MSDREVRALIAAAILLAVLLLARPGMAQIFDRPAKRGTLGTVPELTDEVRAGPLRFAPTVSDGDRQWILAAIANARPEAQRLIAEVDGTVIVDTTLNAPGGIMSPGGQAIGLAAPLGDHVTISLDARELDGERVIDRPMVVLHELGHVIDFELLDDPLRRQLDASIPASRACNSPSDGLGGCTAVEERFADTFAKWALRGRFSLAGSGYGIPTPPSLEDWGMPLGRLAITLDQR
jgi:hypothetical protein